MRRLRPHERFGDYELERKLGLGGMAEVWLAHPVVKGHREARVVIKRVHAHLADDRLVRSLFADEADLLQRIDHPNIVRLLEACLVDGEHFMVMEFIDGLDLHTCLAVHDGPLWPAFAAAVVAQACVALIYAHELKDLSGRPLNLVHRDLSPDNVMIDRQGVVKLVDFGIARATSTQNTTLAGMRKGKVRYLAPEYLSSGAQGPAMDVYGLGATLWELVTGRAPFHEHSGPALMVAVSRQPLPSAATLRPSLPDELVRLIADATAPVERRLPSARAFEQRLRTFLQHFPPPAQAQLGDEVSLWKQRLHQLERGPARPQGGDYGQLESTELVSAGTDPMIAGPTTPGPPTVQVASPLDPTQHHRPLEPTDPMLHRDPGEVTLNVFLPPELEAQAARSPPAATRRPKK